VPPPGVDLVIVHRDKPGPVLRTVDRFLAQSLVPRIVVVDNGSSPAAQRQVREGLPPQVELVEAGANTGFGPGANIGFRWFLAHDPALWLAVCPHDANPLPGCLERLVAVAGAQPRAGLASADVGDGLTPVVDRYFGAIPAPATVVDGWEPAGYPHGTLMLARRECLQAVGLFDERYFAYCEEAELAIRAKEAGWQVGVVRGAEVRNTDVGSRAAVVDYLQLRNTLLMVREHSGLYHSTIRLAIAVWDLLSGAVVPARRGPYWAPRARLLAIAHHLRRRYGPPPIELFGTPSTEPGDDDAGGGDTA
jgi:N-acetylglucosaminyl-diphospho-decaprenol L-rhamnosyltransferase